MWIFREKDVTEKQPSCVRAVGVGCVAIVPIRTPSSYRFSIPGRCPPLSRPPRIVMCVLWRWSEKFLEVWFEGFFRKGLA